MGNDPEPDEKVQPYTDCECQEEVDHELFVCRCGCHRGIWETPR